MLYSGKPYLLHNDTTSSDELISWISHAENWEISKEGEGIDGISLSKQNSSESVVTKALIQ